MTVETTGVPPWAGLRILHVSEAFGGGLAAAVQEYAASTPEAEHLLAYRARPEAPLSRADLLPFTKVVKLHHGPVGPIRTIRRLIRERGVDVVHAHSAFGGGYARLAVRHTRVPIVYTPHCFAFLREDRRAWRWLFASIERALAPNTTAYAACSPVEHRLSSRLAPGRSTFVPNAYSRSPLPADSPVHHASGTVHLLGVGRLTAQKDPGFFAAAVDAVRAAGFDVRATWVGDGDQRLRERLERSGITVTGWVSRDRARRSFSGDDTIYLHTARWEGFPFGILEAHAAATPLIVRTIPSLADYEFPHEMTSPEDAARAVIAILAPGGRAAAVRDDAKPLVDNRPDVQRERLGDLYARIAERS